MKSGNDRKLINFVIQGGPQLRMLLPFAVLFLLNFATLIILDQRVMQIIENPSITLDDNTTLLYRTLAAQIRLISIISILLSSTATFFLWLRYTHKVAGPQVAISRQLNKMIGGDFSSQIQLRSADELQEIAQEINQLTRKLADRQPET